LYDENRDRAWGAFAQEDAGPLLCLRLRAVDSTIVSNNVKVLRV
jgi:hypothetical protein